MSASAPGPDRRPATTAVDRAAPPADVIAALAAQRVVPVLRSRDVGDAVATARACARAGMGAIELTRTTPDVERALELLRDDGLLLGLGTLTDAAQVAPAAAAGASFVVSFQQLPGLCEAAAPAGVAAIPGALTPTEVAAAAAAGADAVKLFPARSLAPPYLRDLRAVLPRLPLMVTGGIAATTAAIAPWLAAGAFAVGLGSDLGTVAENGAAEVERRARAALAAAR